MACEADRLKNQNAWFDPACFGVCQGSQISFSLDGFSLEGNWKDSRNTTALFLHPQASTIHTALTSSAKCLPSCECNSLCL